MSFSVLPEEKRAPLSANLLTQKGVFAGLLLFSWCLQTAPPPGLLTPCGEFGWNYNAVFKGITFKLRTEFGIEFVFWLEEKKMLLETEKQRHSFLLTHGVVGSASGERECHLVSPLPSALARRSPVTERWFQRQLPRQPIPFVKN